MAVRPYQFTTGVTQSTLPASTTPTASEDIISKGYGDVMYSPKNQLGGNVVDLNALKALAAGVSPPADRILDQQIVVSGLNLSYKWAPSSTATTDNDAVVRPNDIASDVTAGRWLKSLGGSGGGSGDTLVEHFDTYAATTTIGESVAANAALCLEIHNGSGSNNYRIFNTNSSLGNRKNSFVGFAKTSGAVTAGVYTYTLNQAYVTSNVVPMTINGRPYSVNFTTSSDNTLQLLATAISADQDVQSAVVTVIGGTQTSNDDRVITITMKGALSANITGTAVTGGASQPTPVVANPTPAVGATVQIHYFGPLGSFSSLTPGAEYFLANSTGAITSTPTDVNPISVGSALSSTVLFVRALSPNLRLGSAEIFVRSHGSSANSNATATQDSEHFNYSTWLAGAASTAGVRTRAIQGGNGAYNNLYYQIDGDDTGVGPGSALLQHYNKATWLTDTARGTSKSRSGAHAYNGYLYALKGYTGSSVNTADKYNGSTWSAVTGFGAGVHLNGAFSVGGLINTMGGNTSSEHDTLNTSDTPNTAVAVFPVTNATNGSSNSPGSKGICGVTSSTANYEWNATTWSASIIAAYSFASSDPFNQSCAFSVARNMTVYNGGSNGSPINTSQTYNGVVFTSTTSSSNSRGGCQGAAF